MNKLEFVIERQREAVETIECFIERILCFGFAGRNQEQVREHIEELRAIGVPSPSETPVIYPAAGYLATLDETIQVLGSDTGPEVEFAFLLRGDQLLVGVASDHTDRALEAYSISRSKQICSKVISSTLWDMEEIEGHWDQLVLRGWIPSETGKELYQDSRADALLPVATLLSIARAKCSLTPDTLILSGTVPALKGMATPTGFWAELVDPILNRRIELMYSVENIELS